MHRLRRSVTSGRRILPCASSPRSDLVHLTMRDASPPVDAGRHPKRRINVSAGVSERHNAPTSAEHVKSLRALLVSAFGALAMLLVSFGSGLAGPAGAAATACTVFPADNVWNQRVDTLPVHPGSAAWVSS